MAILDWMLSKSKGNSVFWHLSIFHTGQTRLELSLVKELMLITEGGCSVIFVIVDGFIFILLQYDYGVACPSIVNVSWEHYGLAASGSVSHFLCLSAGRISFSQWHTLFLIKVKRNNPTKSNPVAGVQNLKSMPAFATPGICHKNTVGVLFRI